MVQRKLRNRHVAGWWLSLLFGILPNGQKGSLMRAVEAASGMAMGLLFVANLALGLVQAAAVFAGLEHWLEWHWLICALIGGFLVFVLRITPVNIVIGILGAHYAWHWPWTWAIGLFLGFFLVILIVSLAAGATQKMFRW